MPDRILRAAILTSDNVNDISWPAEVFYRRLMSIVDDFGRFDARNSILRSQLYPLKFNKVSESDIVKWRDECSKAGLIRFYHVENKEYLEVLKFNQRLRTMKSKYPAPEFADNCPQLTADVSGSPPETKRNETENETDSDLHEIQKFIIIHLKNVSSLHTQMTFENCAKISKDYPEELIKRKLLAMENMKDLTKNYKSVYLTLLEWCKRAQEQTFTK